MYRPVSIFLILNFTITRCVLGLLIGLLTITQTTTDIAGIKLNKQDLWQKNDKLN